MLARRRGRGGGSGPGRRGVALGPGRVGKGGGGAGGSGPGRLAYALARGRVEMRSGGLMVAPARRQGPSDEMRSLRQRPGIALGENPLDDRLVGPEAEARLSEGRRADRLV